MSHGEAPARYTFLDHTGELRLHVVAPTLAALFEQAGRALAEQLLERASGAGLDTEVVIELQARDTPALLAAWLNELIFLSETRKRVFTELHVLGIDDTRLRARVRGIYPESLRTAVKAATLHELAVRQVGQAYVADVVLDV
jgi:SHS2 domain-containing protein